MSSVVYFIECCGRIKIGITENLKSRLAKISTYAPRPIALIGTVPGDFADEARFHIALSEYKSNGEWFLDCVEVRRVIEAALKSGGTIFPEKREPSPNFEPPADSGQEDHLFKELQAIQRRFEYLINCRLSSALKAARQLELDGHADRGSLVSQIVDIPSYQVARVSLKKNYESFVRLTEASFKAIDADVPSDSFLDAASALIGETETAFGLVLVRKSEYALDIQKQRTGGEKS